MVFKWSTSTRSNNQNYTASSLGNYTVIVTKNECVSAASNVININISGIDEIDNPNQLSIYPNPNTGDFTVEFNSTDKSAYTIGIANAIGKIIYKEEVKDLKGAYTKSLNISEAVRGVYTLRLFNPKNQTAQKIIIY